MLDFSGPASLGPSAELAAAHPAACADDVNLAAQAFNEHRKLLLSIAYRMLGTMADAEDILQDAFIRWQQSRRAAIESPKAFLVTIVSRLCIDYLKSARVRREEYFGPWLPEPCINGSPAASALASADDDSLSIAFLMLLERLSPAERAVFLLREVFEYEYREIAGVIGQTEVACRQILRRARQRVAQDRPRFQPSLEDRDKLFQQFLQASSRGDLEGLISILHHDVVLYADGGGKSFAVPRPVSGAENVARFMLRAPRKFLPRELIRCLVSANGQPAVVTYLNGQPQSVFTAQIVSGRIRNLYIISNPDKLSRVPELLVALS